MKDNPYPAYKDSGIDWLGPVPSHWTVAPLKTGFQVRLGKMLQPQRSSADDQFSPYVRAANVQWWGVDTTDIKEMWLSSLERERLLLEEGDLLVSEGGDVGRAAIWRGQIAPCYFQNSINRVRAVAQNSTRYLYYWMSTLKDKGYIDVLCNKSTIAHFTAEKVQTVPTPFPPPKEQAAIAAFLDRETGKIDTLVGEQKRLIELLKEKRQAIISQAVTKGLDPNVPMKPSGGEWLGDVPEHWELVPVKRLSSSITSGPRGWSDQLTDEGRIFFQSQNIGRAMDIVLADCKRILPTDDTESQRAALSRDDVVVCITGARTGAVAHVHGLPEPAYINQHVCLVRPKDVAGRFMAYSLTSIVGQQQLKIAMYGLKQGLSLEDIRETTVLLPPEEEQVEITSWLDAQTSTIDALINEAEVAAALLAERRSALISAAVTGKIDVRPARADEEMVA